MGIDPTELTGIRTALQGLMPDHFRNRRTSSTSIGRLAAGKRPMRIPGISRFVHIPSYQAKMPDTVLPQPGDILEWYHTQPDGTQTLGGIYCVIFLESGLATYSYSTMAQCAAVTMTSDGTWLPVPPNATVTFTHPDEATPLTAEVYLYPADRDVHEYGLAPALKWAILFDPTLAWPDGTLVDAGCRVSSAGSLGTKRDNTTPKSAVLSDPRREFGILPICTAYFQEPA